MKREKLLAELLDKTREDHANFVRQVDLETKEYIAEKGAEIAALKDRVRELEERRSETVAMCEQLLGENKRLMEGLTDIIDAHIESHEDAHVMKEIAREARKEAKDES